MIALCDCNSFYASSERLFRADLYDKPIIVLSNNDGCIVSLCPKAKALGFKRGDNYFEIKNDLKGAVAFSSNYTLYNALSERVMSKLIENSKEFIPYSIDEAFFVPLDNNIQKLRDEITQGVGIAVTITLARTKTLAKAASKIAKKMPECTYILKEEDEDELLKSMKLEDVWQIGSQTNKYFMNKGLRSAKDLKDAMGTKIVQDLRLHKICQELNGIPAQREEERNTSFSSGLTFKESTSSFEEVLKTLTTHVHYLCDKLNKKDLLAKTIAINVFTSRFREDFYCPFVKIELDNPTSYIPEISSACEKALKKCFIPAFYKGSRVFITQVVKKENSCYTIFDTDDDIILYKKRDKLALLAKEIRQKHGHNGLSTLRSTKTDKEEITSSKLKSPSYLNNFKTLPNVY